MISGLVPKHCILHIIVPYCTVSFRCSLLMSLPIFNNSMHISPGPREASGCVPRICLNYCGFVRAESTKRRALILGSSSFAINKCRASPAAVLNPRNCDGTPNQALKVKGKEEKKLDRCSFALQKAPHNGVENKKRGPHVFIMSWNRRAAHPRHGRPRRRVGGKTSTLGCRLAERVRSGRRAACGV